MFENWFKLLRDLEEINNQKKNSARGMDFANNMQLQHKDKIQSQANKSRSEENTK